jgi:hypothetical protein
MLGVSTTNRKGNPFGLVRRKVSMNEPRMMPEFDPATNEWLVPDAAEFVKKTGWVHGRFVTCKEIEGVVRFKNKLVAITECRLLCQVIKAAQEIEEKFGGA